jgi:ABC-type amino acid transport substrate-binding protein
MSFVEGYARRLGVLEYLGTWDAETNTPTLTSGVGQKNGYYIVSNSGTTNLNGITDWDPGDWAIFNGTTMTWEQIDNQRGGLSLLDGGSAPDTVFDSNVTIDGGAAT